jgi:hypothetical protein
VASAKTRTGGCGKKTILRTQNNQQMRIAPFLKRLTVSRLACSSRFSCNHLRHLTSYRATLNCASVRAFPTTMAGSRARDHQKLYDGHRTIVSQMISYGLADSDLYSEELATSHTFLASSLEGGNVSASF